MRSVARRPGVRRRRSGRPGLAAAAGAVTASLAAHPRPAVPPAGSRAPLRARPPGPRRVPSTLTPREREIAALIARGLSNRAIADELVISQATVARHVANMLTKLGFSSRAQVAAWVARQPGPDA